MAKTKKRVYKLKGPNHHRVPTIELIPDIDGNSGYMWIGDYEKCYGWFEHKDKLRKLAHGILKMIGDK